MARRPTLGHALLFAGALLAAIAIREGAKGHLTQSIIWLPSGVGVAGLYWLGPSSWWVVAVTTFLQRLYLGYDLGVALPGTLGSTGEALLGALLLRRLKVGPGFDRLADVLGLFVVAAVAPLASIAASWPARAMVWTDPAALPFYSGWDGWWRMNALGILVVVPVVGTALARPRPDPRPGNELLRAVEVGVPTLALLWVVMTWLSPGTLGIQVIYLTLFVALWGSLRHGPRGAVTSAATTALAVAWGTAHGHGPFLSVPLEDRHGALQVFELSLLAVPLVVGALVAERQANASLLEWQAQVLEQIAAGQPPEVVAEGLARGLASRCGGGAACAVLVVEDGLTRVLAAPGLDPALVAALEGRPAGPEAGGAGDWWSVPLRVPDGSVVGSIAVHLQEPRPPLPAELRLAERAAVLAGLAIDRQRREDLLRSLNRNVSDGLFRSTPHRGFLYANEAFARMFGFARPEEVLGVSPASLFQQPARREELLRLVEERGAFQDEEVQFRRRDGTGFQGLVSWTGVRGAGGRLEYLDGAVADITARKALEEQLRQSQKMEALGKLAGGVAHDFNNLLTVIGGYAQTARDALPPEAEARRDVEEVLTAAGRAARLTGQLLAYSRQQVLQPQVLDLASTLGELGGMLRRLIAGPVELVIEPGAGPCRVRADRGQLEQVVVNLAVNARDAMPRGGTLTIAAEAVEVGEALARRQPELTPGPHVALSVRDTGQGMASDVRRRAFDPFFTTKEKGKGTGLGLSIVYGIVRQSGGAVWLDSVLGAGTTAWVYLPRVDQAAEAEAALPALASHGGVGTVLVAEDEPVVRGLVTRTLRRSGYQVLEAADGLEALEVSRHHPGAIDAVVSDVVMPRMGGRELVRRLLVERPAVRVLLMSGYPDGALDGRELETTRSDFLQKPFSAVELSARLEALLA